MCSTWQSRSFGLRRPCSSSRQREAIDAKGVIAVDRNTYCFKSLQCVKFHDGSVITTDDVRYSLMRFMLLDADGGPSWILLASILGFDVQSTRDDNGKLLPDIWDRVNQAI